MNLARLVRAADLRGTRAGRRASAGATGAPSRSLRRIACAGRGAGRPSSSVEIRRTRQSTPASAKIASAKLGPRAVARCGEVPDPTRPILVDELAHAERQMPDEGRAAALVVDDVRPRRARRRAGASSARSCGRSARRATSCARSRRSTRPRPRRAASCARTRRAGSGRPTRRTARPCDRRRRSRTRRRRAARRARRRSPFRPRSPRPPPAGRPPRRRHPSRPPCAGRGRARLVTALSLGGFVTSQSSRLERDEIVVRERVLERAAELAAGARDQDATAASRADRVGVLVLHSPTTRGSFQGIVCSSGSAGSYSAVTW